MTSVAHELAQKLALRAEAVCRHYLSNGRKNGAYWQVGDVANTPGASLFVKLKGPASGKGAAGRWTDAATGEYGDMLDLIRQAKGFTTLAETLKEARAFLHLPDPVVVDASPLPGKASNSDEAARRLFKKGEGFRNSPVDRYLASRGLIVGFAPLISYHPSCTYKDEEGTLTKKPAMLLAVCNGHGLITGVHRTYLTKEGHKAPVPDPKRMLGLFQGSSAVFGKVGEVLVAGEGLETVLTIRTLLPTMPVAVGVSAPHLPLIPLPPGLKRLYIALDNDEAGKIAAARLSERAGKLGIEVYYLAACLKDWNDDLMQLPRELVMGNLLEQLDPVDRPAVVRDSAA